MKGLAEIPQALLPLFKVNDIRLNLSNRFLRLTLKFIYRLTLRFYLFPCLSTGIPIHFNGTLYFDFYYSVVVVAVRLATWQILLSLPRCRSIPEWRVVMLLQGSRSRNRGSPWCSFSFWTFFFKRFPPCNRLLSFRAGTG